MTLALVAAPSYGQVLLRTSRTAYAYPEPLTVGVTNNSAGARWCALKLEYLSAGRWEELDDDIFSNTPESFSTKRPSLIRRLKPGEKVIISYNAYAAAHAKGLLPTLFDQHLRQYRFVVKYSAVVEGKPATAVSRTFTIAPQ
ncbi:hypothetical protein [Hymenobacter coalescens]